MIGAVLAIGPGFWSVSDKSGRCAFVTSASGAMRELLVGLGGGGKARLEIARELRRLINEQYQKRRNQHESDVSKIDDFLKRSKDPAAASILVANSRRLNCIAALLEIAGDHLPRAGAFDVESAWKEFIEINRIRPEEGKKVKAFERRLDAALAEYDGLSGRFARRLSGNTKLGRRRHLQNAFNGRHSWPMVLVA